MSQDRVLEQVRDRYAEAARAVSERGHAACCGPQAAAFDDNGETFGAARYDQSDLQGLPEDAVMASLGCGNPLMVADLRPGERVLDLGSGGGIDVLLSAKRVGPTGTAIGLDMTEEMLSLARANAEKAGAKNVEFLKGQIEAIPLPAGSIDVIISNCVVNLSPDKPAVLAEMHRVLVPGGRIGISDVVAEDHVTPEQRAERGSHVGCIAGALSKGEYLTGLAAAGFAEASVEFTHEATPGLHGAIIRATKPPARSDARSTAESERQGRVEHRQPTVDTQASCCSSSEQAFCCEPAARSTCCGSEQPTGSCGCQ